MPSLRAASLVCLFGGFAALQARASSVGQEFHGLPSFILPMALLLAAVSLGAFLIDGGDVNELLGPATMLVLLFLSLFIAVRLPGLISATDREIAIENLRFYVRDALIVTALLFSVERVAGLMTAVTGLVAAGTVTAALAIHKAVTGSIASDYWGFSRTATSLVSADETGTRFTGPFEDPNFYAQSLVVVVGLSLGLAAGSRSGPRRAGFAAAAAVSIGGVALTLSRGGFVAVAVIVVLLLLRRSGYRMVLGLVAISILLIPLAPSALLDRVASVTEAPTTFLDRERAEDPSVSGRSSEMLAAIEMFADHPVLGVGAGNYDTNYLKYSTDIGLDERRIDRAAHNLFLEAAAELGVFGLAGFLVFVGGATIVPGRVRRRLQAAGDFESAALADGIQLAVIGYLLTAVFLHDAFSRLFVLVAALGFASIMLQRGPGTGEAPPTNDNDGRQPVAVSG